MKHTMKTLLSVLLALTMICGLLLGMLSTAYAVTQMDVYNLIDNLSILRYQLRETPAAYGAVSEAIYALDSAFYDADYKVTPEVEAAYNSALAVYQQYSGGGGHTHSWGYQASGSTVTATCTGDGNCDYKTNGVTLTINAPPAWCATAAPRRPPFPARFPVARVCPTPPASPIIRAATPRPPRRAPTPRPSPGAARPLP